MNIKTKILASFAVAVLLFAAVGMYATLAFSSARRSTTEITGSTYPAAEAVARMVGAQLDMQRVVWALQIRRLDGAQRASLMKEYESAAESLDASRKAWLAMKRGGAEGSQGEKAFVSSDAWRRHSDRVVEIAKKRMSLVAGGASASDSRVGEVDEENLSEAAATMEPFAQARRDFMELDALIGDSLNKLAERTESSGEVANTVLNVSLVLVGLALLSLGYFFSRSVGRSLEALVSQAGLLTESARSGKLDVRADEKTVDDEFRPIVLGMNATVDAFAQHLTESRIYLERISRGDLPKPIETPYSGDFEKTREALNRCIETIGGLVKDVRTLGVAAVEGRFKERADETRQEGAFRELIVGVNRAIASLVGHLDRLPTPAFSIDPNFKFRWVNAALASVAGMSAESLVGHACHEVLKAGDCRTERCACMRAMRDNGPAASSTVVRGTAKELEIDYSALPLNGLDGRSIVGAMEFVQDQTAIKQAVRTAEKVGQYQATSAQSVTLSLEALAQGDLSVHAELPTSDKETKDAGEVFERIVQALKHSSQRIAALVNDTRTLSEAAVAGRLDVRADPSSHQGDYAKIVEGVNAALDAVVAPVEEARRVATLLAERDLRARVNGEYAGDHSKLKDAVNSTADALNEALSQVASAVSQVSSASTEIASSSQAVASGASQQAATLEQTSASLESVASLTKRASDNASQANTLAQSARSAATEGAGAVNQMLGVMGKIRTAAEGTSQIIKDVSDIAFQTNLLALNAAVEAARAGEAGRGFAVVAEEVRSLALRAKVAAQKTEELIRESVRQAGEGEQTSKHVAAKLSEIVDGVGKVSTIVAEITASAKEQATGIEEVTKAIGEMDKVTQQNAASAEESSSAASELSGQAEELAAMVGTFRISEVGQEAGRRNGAKKSAKRTELALPASARRAPEIPDF